MKTAAAQLIFRMRARLDSETFSTSTSTHKVVTRQPTPKRTCAIMTSSFIILSGPSFHILKTPAGDHPATVPSLGIHPAKILEAHGFNARNYFHGTQFTPASLILANSGCAKNKARRSKIRRALILKGWGFEFRSEEHT